MKIKRKPFAHITKRRRELCLYTGAFLITLSIGIFSQYAIEGESFSKMLKASVILDMQEEETNEENMSCSPEKMEDLYHTIATLKASMAALCPKNAYLEGNECFCDEGYGMDYNKTFCAKIPANAHYIESVTDVWKCDEGYREVGESCFRINISEESQLSFVPSFKEQIKIHARESISETEKQEHLDRYNKSMEIWKRLLEEGTIDQNKYERQEKIARSRHEMATGERVN